MSILCLSTKFYQVSQLWLMYEEYVSDVFISIYYNLLIILDVFTTAVLKYCSYCCIPFLCTGVYKSNVYYRS